MDTEWIQKEIRNKLHRLEVYEDDWTKADWISWLRDIQSELDGLDDIHDDCCHEEHDEIDDKEREIERLEKSLRERQDTIDDLNDKIARFIKKKSKVSELTPAENRSQFRVIITEEIDEHGFNKH